MFVVRYLLALSVLALSVPMVFHAVPVFAQDGKTHGGTEQAKKLFNAEEFTLKNGMRVVVIPNHRVPVVTHMVWYGVGAADEPRGKSGVAHFLEHLMFKGSTGLRSGEFSRKIKRLGGENNAFTGQDYTAYYESISKEHLETVMQMEAGRMRGMKPPLEEVASELKVILEERNQRIDNTPSAKFSEHLNAALFVNHPYGIPVIGWRHEMEALTWDKVKAFYDRYYAPNNAILVVSGDVTGDEVLALAKKYYGPLKPEILPPRVRTKSPPLAGTPVFTMHDPQVKQAQYQLLMRAPSCHQNRKDCLALSVLQDIMSGGATSRLYDSLVVNQKIASSAGFSYNGETWDDATVSLYATPAAGQDVVSMQTALDQELELLVKEGVTQKEVDDAIARIQAASIYARDSVSGPAMMVGSAMITGASLEDVEYQARDIASVSAEQVNALAKKYFDPDNPDITKVRGYLLPLKDDDGDGQ